MKIFFCSLMMSIAVFSNSSFATVSNPLSYMVHEAKSEQCQTNRSAAKVSKGQIKGLGAVTIVALPIEGCDGGNNWGTSIWAFYQGKHVDLGGAKTVENLVIEHNQVIIHTTEQGENDPDCCPTKHVKIVYSVVNGKLKALK